VRIEDWVRRVCERRNSWVRREVLLTVRKRMEMTRSYQYFEDEE
jgi:hypothetical protein